MFCFAADQTPTPTRFIRNCEEVGLFDDLKHVNPFEETFRQAIDSTEKRPNVLFSAQKSLEIIKCNDEDTLHTPHIIPYNGTIGDNQKNTESCSDEQPASTPVTLSDEKIEPISEAVTDELPVDSKDDNEAEQIEKPKSHKNQLQNSKTKETRQTQLRKICPKPAVVAGANPIKEKIRESLLKLRTTRSTVEPYNRHIPYSKPLIAKEIPKNEIKRQAIATNIKTTQDSGSNERNREAAKRYRHNQKIRYDKLLQRNAQLEAENGLLKQQLQIFKRKLTLLNSETS